MGWTMYVTSGDLVTSKTIDLNGISAGSQLTLGECPINGLSTDHYSYMTNWYPSVPGASPPLFGAQGFASYQFYAFSANSQGGPGLLTVDVSRASLGLLSPTLYLTLIDSSAGSASSGVVAPVANFTLVPPFWKDFIGTKETDY